MLDSCRNCLRCSPQPARTNHAARAHRHAIPLTRRHDAVSRDLITISSVPISVARSSRAPESHIRGLALNLRLLRDPRSKSITRRGLRAGRTRGPPACSAAARDWTGRIRGEASSAGDFCSLFIRQAADRLTVQAQSGTLLLVHDVLLIMRHRFNNVGSGSERPRPLTGHAPTRHPGGATSPHR